MNDKLIFIKDASNYFDAEGNPEGWGQYKYLIISDSSNNNISMLLMIERNPFKYHAEALLSFMKENNLSDIKINGGGKLRIDPVESQIDVSGKSFAFGKANPKEVSDFLNSVWPAYVVDTTLMEIDIQREDMATSGVIFSFSQVKHEVDNP